MNIFLAITSLITLSSFPTFGKSTALVSRPDSVPAQQRYHFKLASDGSSSQKQWSTLVIYPTKTRSRNEISLPIGFNPATVRVSLGNRVLQVDEDYVFIPNANRIRVLDEEALTSQQPIKIAYEGVTNTNHKRLTLRYKP